MVDYDGDGCRDETEDLDDDNDEFEDVGWMPKWTMNWTVDDFDGCDDNLEDTDTDDENEPRRFCPNGAQYGTPSLLITMILSIWMRTITMITIHIRCLRWLSNWSNWLTGAAYDDSEASGPREDLDDDNDGVLDSILSLWNARLDFKLISDQDEMAVAMYTKTRRWWRRYSTRGFFVLENSMGINTTQWLGRRWVSWRRGRSWRR